MHSVVYVACLLAAYAAASPAQVERRAFGFPGAGGHQSSQSSSQQAAASSQSSYNSGFNGGVGAYGANVGGYGGAVGGIGAFGGPVGPIGGGGYSSQSSSSYPESSSSSSVINSFSGLGSQIAQMQSYMASGSMTQQVAIQQMSQLASSFQYALNLAPQCGSCFAQSAFSSSVSSVFQQLTQLMTSIQSTFGGSFGQICAPFAGLQQSFQSFFHSASSSGISLDSIVPNAFVSALDPVIPGLASSLSSFGINSQSSSSYSSSSSSSSVMDSFAGLGSQIAQLQSHMESGSMTQQFASQQMSQLASSFQSALNLAPQCGSCFAQGAFSNSVSSVFQQFTRLITSMHSTFGGSFGQICAPFAGLQQSFQSFFHSASSSGISLNSIVPNAFVSAMAPVIPGLPSSLSSLGFK